MAERTNGGVFYGNVLSGILRHFTLSGAGFNGAIDVNGTPVHNSAAEIIFLEISRRATIAIMNPLRLDNYGMSFALETNRADWTDDQLQAMIRALGTIGVDNVDVSGITVTEVPYSLGVGGAGGVGTFLELTDTPGSYAGAANQHVVVNATEDGLIFVAGSGSDLVTSVFGRIGDVVAEAGDYSAFYATLAQGALADSALQTGDNVSLLVNDAGYVTFGDFPEGLVTSVFGRAGEVVATEGDYDIGQMGDVDVTTVTPAVGQILEWNGVNFVPADKTATGSDTFIGLPDTPTVYTGNKGKMVVVGDTEDQLVFIDREDEVAYAKQIDFVSELVFYTGQADPGTALGAASWRIKRSTLNTEDDLSEEWADGVSDFTKIWNDRLSLSYS